MDDLGSLLKENIPLTEMIQTLRNELQAAEQVGRDSTLNFGVESVDIELSVVVGRERGTEGEAKFWVLSLGGSQKASHLVTHKFVLRMKPQRKDGKPVKVSDTSQEFEGRE